jgi:hypothetical protein
MFRSRFESFFPFRFSVGFVSFSVLELSFHQTFDALFGVLCRRFFLLGSRPGSYFSSLSFCCTIFLLVSDICLFFFRGEGYCQVAEMFVFTVAAVSCFS